MSIHLRNLTRIYGKQKAVNNISFSAGRGEILGFLGPNGAGKTTTMKILTGFIRPDSGEVRVNGIDVLEKPIEARKQIGYLPEHNPLYPEMYVHEFLNFSASLYQLPRKSIRSRVAEMIEVTGLGREQHKKIGMLSKGYRQRVGLAQALIHDPQVLILDEPTTGLDPNQIVEIRNLIKSLGQNKTVIFSSHILSEVETISDRVIIINRGEIVADAETAGIRNAGSGEAIQVEFELPGFDLTALQNHQGVLTITEESGERKFLFRVKRESDIRKLLYDESIRQNNAILSMRMEKSSLEDVFRKLTGDNN